MRRPFTLEYWLDDGWYVGRVREVPGVFSQGETLEELEANLLRNGKRHDIYRSRLALARLTATQRGACGRLAPRWVAVKR